MSLNPQIRDWQGKTVWLIVPAPASVRRWPPHCTPLARTWR